MRSLKQVKSTVAPARQAAFTILLTLERGQAHSDDLLRGRSVSKLSAPDRHLATALVLGVLRWQIQLDAQFKGLLARPNAKLDPEILIALRVGAFQILHLDRIPAHAAIDESVQLARDSGHRFASGMVNAILRKLSAAHSADPNSGNCDLPSVPTPAQLAAACAHPGWMVERWSALFGMERTCAICSHDQQAPPFSIRVVAPDAGRSWNLPRAKPAADSRSHRRQWRRDCHLRLPRRPHPHSGRRVTTRR
jgi:16S rRNA (cytosine967-C5)-methyltransferase